MNLHQRIMQAQDVALCFVRKWWRPLICIGMGGSIVVNGIVIPLLTRTQPDLMGLAALFTAASPFAVMRGFEKKWGAAET